jgi:uncharacterized membrane protein
MLRRTQNFIRTTLIGGVIVILPTIILVLAFKWLFGFVANAIRPLTNLAVDTIPLPARFNEPIATLIVLAVIILACFLLGLFVRTRLGQIIYSGFEKGILSRAPGYRMIKETVNHFIGRKESPFSSVAMVQLFENETLVTAFITDRHGDGRVTVFVPTGPNPTSGFIYHLDQRFVHRVDVSVDEAMRSVISCGAGSEKLIKGLRKDA